MGIEINLLANYPKIKRNTKERRANKTKSIRAVSRRFGKEFFDGDRLYGYGGFTYHPRFWEPVVPDFKKHFDLEKGCTILDVGCAKGFMLYDFKRLIPGIEVRGIDISEYAINNAMPEMKPLLQIADAKNLPFMDNAFDLVISINTVHNLEINDCLKALQEIERVSRGKSFITVDAFRNKDEEKKMSDWNLTARTIMHVDEWRKFFKKAGYSGDYYWFIP